MSDLLQPIKSMVHNNVTTKATYRKALEALDPVVAQFLSDIGYDSGDHRSQPLFVHTTDERLDMVNDKMNLADTIPESTLAEFVRHASDIIHDFLEYNYFGNLHDFYMKQAGIFTVEVSCILSSHCLDDMDSAKQHFKNQLARLKELGIVIVTRKDMPAFSFLDNNDNNRQIIRDVLIKRGAFGVEFLSDERYIRDITFSVRARDINNFAIQEDTALTEMNSFDKLTSDEMSKIRSLLKTIDSSLMSMECLPNMVQTCGFIVESSFAEICRTFGYNGVLLRRINARYAKERAKNLNIRDIEKNLGANFDPDMAEEAFNKLKAGLNQFAVNRLHMSINNLRVGRYGNTTVSLRVASSDDDLMLTCYDTLNGIKIVPVDYETLIQVFDIIPDYINSKFYIQDCDKNKDAIADVLAEISGVDVKRFSSYNIGGHWCLESIDLVVCNIGKVIQYYENSLFNTN